ncbi:MAG: sigma-70 family RNA polymerase sigma factor [Oscillospiraceae bacterium]|nr:sigma-70 family RNA polymerase sigma factor [Oscillospiraceae bacterium]
MDDNSIIQLFNARDEAALSELSKKHGTFFIQIAENILRNREDSQVCVNDAYLKAWDTIPPARPKVLRAFVGKIVKCVAVSMFRMNTTEKRGGGEVTLVLEELSECVSDGKSLDDELDGKQIVEAINKFLRGCREFDRRVFILRYWHCKSVADIAVRFGTAENKVSVSLYRTRQKLREHLAKEGYTL